MARYIPWQRLQAWNGQLFLLAGVLLAGVALYKGIGAFTAVNVPSAVDTLYGGLGLLAPVVALFGIYPPLREKVPRLATAGVVAAAVSASFVLLVWTWFLGTAVRLGRFPRIPEEAPLWAALALVGNFLTLATGFLLIGLGSRRAVALPRRTGLLLLVPGLLWLALLVNIPLGVVAELDVYVYVVNAIAVFAVGYLLLSARQTPDGTAAIGDTAP